MTKEKNKNLKTNMIPEKKIEHQMLFVKSDCRNTNCDFYLISISIVRCQIHMVIVFGKQKYCLIRG